MPTCPAERARTKPRPSPEGLARRRRTFAQSAQFKVLWVNSRQAPESLTVMRPPWLARAGLAVWALLIAIGCSGDNNMLCPTPPAAGETIVIPPALDAALAAAATQFPNLVFVAPKFEASNCAAFSAGGPHLTAAGNTAVARVIGAAFVGLQ